MEDQIGERSVIQSVDRALSIMEELAREQKGSSLTELSGQMDLHPSTAHRLLATLMSRGYVIQDPATRKYGLGMKIVQLYGGLDVVTNLIAIAGEHVQRLALTVGETVNLVVLDGTDGIIVDRVESRQTLKYSVPIGTRLPLYCTGAGKVLLAYQPSDEIDGLLGRELTSLTPNTITDRYQLQKELEHIRTRGYAIDKEERELGVRCVAAPVWDHAGRVLASVSVSGPSRRMTSQHLVDLGEQVKRTTRLISTSLGYQTRTLEAN